MSVNKKFNFMDLLNIKSIEESAEKVEDFTEINLSPYDVKPSKSNFYSQESIKELADTFLMVGQQQPTVLGRVEGEFRILSGHRRNLANIFNCERGHTEYKKIRYWYKDMTETMFELSLLIGNAFNRELTQYEKTEQASRLKETLMRAREQGEIEVGGSLRYIIADVLKTSETQIARMEKINKDLIEEAKEQFKDGNLTITGAYETSRLEPSEQKEIVASLAAGEKIQAKSITERVEERKEIAKQQENEKREQKDAIEKAIKEATEPLVKKVQDAEKRAKDASIQAAQATVAAERAAENADYSAENVKDAIENKMSDSDNMEDCQSVAERAMDALRSLLRKIKYISEGDVIVLEEMLIECNQKERVD